MATKLQQAAAAAREGATKKVAAAVETAAAPAKTRGVKERSDAEETTAPASQMGLVNRSARAGAVAVSGGDLDFAADAGMGMEGADKDSFAIPFIAILQGLSPQLETIEGAKPGLFINTVTNELQKEVTFVPVAFQRRFNRWVPRDAGGGFKGALSVAEVEQMRADGETEEHEKLGLVHADSGDQLKDTRNHFVLVVDEEQGSWTPAVISLASTQIKNSKKLMSLLRNRMIDGPKGKINPPAFSGVYKATSANEENAKGAWKGFAFAFVEPVKNAALYAAAKQFHSEVSAGTIQVTAPPTGLEEEQGESDKF